MPEAPLRRYFRLPEDVTTVDFVHQIDRAASAELIERVLTDYEVTPSIGRKLERALGLTELGERLGLSAAALKKTVDALVEAGRLCEAEEAAPTGVGGMMPPRWLPSPDCVQDVRGSRNILAALRRRRQPGGREGWRRARGPRRRIWRSCGGIRTLRSATGRSLRSWDGRTPRRTAPSSRSASST